jgi:hypothetical protein
MAKPLPTQIPPDAEARFWAKVDRRGPDECWPWLGAYARRGYGRIFVAGGTRIATRVALVLAGRQPAARQLACHSCDNPSCVNPTHLWWGSYTENAQDAAKKGRTRGHRTTHCPAGHEYTPENTYVSPRRDRRCQTCRYEQKKAHQEAGYHGRSKRRLGDPSPTDTKGEAK